MGGTLFGHMILTQDGVTVSLFQPGLSDPKQEIQILSWVQVGIQSPEGITTTRGLLRRFNDFLKLFAALKKAFPRKNVPPAPPKGLLRMKSRELLEERRCSLEEWTAKLLSDIELSRSVAVASFLELEAAARSSFQNENQNISEANTSINSTNSSVQVHPSSSLSMVAGSTSLTSDYGSDTAYEPSDIGTASLGRDNNSEVGTEDLSLDEDLTSPIEKFMKYGMSNIDEGLFMGQAILEELEGFPRHKLHAREINSVIRNNIDNGDSKASYLAGNRMGLLSESEHGKVIGHARKLSTESVGSDISSLRGSESSNLGFPNSLGDGLLDLPGGAEVSRTVDVLSNAESHFSSDAQLLLPSDQRHNMNKLLVAMQRRLVTAKTDMEDLVSRLHQEIAVKDYLTTKVTDLEVELETTKQKSKENLQQAILIEREGFTQMQWDMEELRRKSLEMELKLNSQQDAKLDTEPAKVSVIQEKDALLQELDATRQQLQNLLKRHEELEVKSKMDIKVLVKEVKSLRSSQVQLKQEHSESMKEKAEAERLLQQEKERTKHVESAWRKLLHECAVLHSRLQECNNFLTENEDKLVMDSSSVSDALDLLTTSDNQIGVLLAEAQNLAQDDGNAVYAVDNGNGDIDDDRRTMHDELRKMLTDIFIDNARLRKQVNSLIRCALKLDNSSDEKDVEAPSLKIVLNNFLGR
ncbi:PX domain-containing protein EREL1-like isoform X2 [Cornus florida]|uniref:PX domain-containing protein EREL1-like isoform X2 n=1 Tax=Cornus florida TaxID=4283 RepID=UPI00289DC170|nr:PX domain-containing protein EREL1-like isoform X2 [Cornus florida]